MRLSFGPLVPVIGLLGSLALAPACEEELPSTNVKSFTDQAGRACSTDTYDSSGTAECDVEASTLVMCEDGWEPVFTIGATLMGELQNCAACLDEPNRTTVVESMTCAFVTCNTDADCVEDRYTCQSSTCKS